MQDETQVVTEDNVGDVQVQGTETSSKTSKGDDKGTSAPKTHTEDEVKAATTKAVSDAEAAKGRDWKKLNTRAEAAEGRLTEIGDELTQLQKDRDERELEGVKDKPELLNIYQERQKLGRREAELKRERAELNREKAEQKDAVEGAQKAQVQADAARIAAKEGVDATQLSTLTDGTPEKMEALAKVLPKLTKENADKVTVTKPDSGETSGGPGKPSAEQLENMTMEQYAEYVKKRGERKV